MSYVLYPLRFDSPVHFGMAGEGGGLERTGFTFPADSLFSALCAELAALGEESELDALYEKAQAGRILFSDLLPWQESGEGELAFFLPRPVIGQGSGGAPGASYEETCRQATAYKRQKKLKYLRASRLQAYLAALDGGEPFADEEACIGTSTLRQRVNCREETTLPYFVGQFDFTANAGLYLLAYVSDEADAEWLQALLAFVGRGGIGGKRSSGYGAFQLADDPILLDADVVYADDAALFALLTAMTAPRQMAVSSVLPTEAEVETVRQGAYRLRKSGGFITGARFAEKKDSVCMVEAGSCFARRIAGSIACLGECGAHPVWRYGRGLFVGMG